MKERNIKIILQYLGTNYHGWQKQTKGKTLQSEVEKAIKKIFKQKVDLIGSGRTDAGVHSLGQTANFSIKHTIPSDRIKYAINSQLPLDIRVIHSAEMPLDFHSRYNSIGKTYEYKVYNNNIINPFYKDISYFVPNSIDFDKIYKAKDYFLGEHDFKGFMSSGSSVKNTVRKIYNFEIKKEDKMIEFTITGNGFLYNMVRIIVGTLLEIGMGKIELDELPNIINNKDRNLAGHTVKAKGLCLKRVYYKDNIDIKGY